MDPYEHIRTPNKRGNGLVVSIPYRRIAYRNLLHVEKSIDDMLKNDHIEESNSPYSSPILLVPANESPSFATFRV